MYKQFIEYDTIFLLSLNSYFKSIFVVSQYGYISIGFTELLVSDNEHRKSAEYHSRHSYCVSDCLQYLFFQTLHLCHSERLFFFHLFLYIFVNTSAVNIPDLAVIKLITLM